MGDVLTPLAADALGLAFTGVDTQDPDGINTASPRVMSAETFGKPIQDEVLALIPKVYYAPFEPLKIRNETGSTLTAGTPLAISSWSAANDAYLVVSADAAGITPPIGVTETNLLTATNGYAKLNVIVGSIDTSGTTVGDNVWLDSGGGLAFADPGAITDNLIRVGKVDSVAVSGTVAFCNPEILNIGSQMIRSLSIGTSHLAALAVTNAKIANSTIDLTAKVAGTLPVANGGTGVASLTAYAPVFGGTTGAGAVQSGTVGTSGQVLTSNGAGVLPSFAALPATTLTLGSTAISGGASGQVLYNAAGVVGEKAVTGTGDVVLGTAPTISTIELGHASDTTISRVSAGVAAIEGATIYTQGGALGTPGSGMATNLIGLPLTTGVTGQLPVANMGNESIAAIQMFNFQNFR